MNELFFLLPLALIAGFLVGWDLSAHRERRARIIVEANFAKLEDQLSVFHKEIATDPQRAWLNMGKSSALNEIDRTVLTIRNTIHQDLAP